MWRTEEPSSLETSTGPRQSNMHGRQVAGSISTPVHPRSRRSDRNALGALAPMSAVIRAASATKEAAFADRLAKRWGCSTHPAPRRVSARQKACLESTEPWRAVSGYVGARSRNPHGTVVGGG